MLSTTKEPALLPSSESPSFEIPKLTAPSAAGDLKDTDKRPLIANLVDSRGDNEDKSSQSSNSDSAIQLRPVINTSGLIQIPPITLKLPGSRTSQQPSQAPQITPIVPSNSYNQSHPEYYPYQSKYSSYRNQLPPLSHRPVPSNVSPVPGDGKPTTYKPQDSNQLHGDRTKHTYYSPPPSYPAGKDGHSPAISVSDEPLNHLLPNIRLSASPIVITSTKEGHNSEQNPRFSEAELLRLLTEVKASGNAKLMDYSSTNKENSSDLKSGMNGEKLRRPFICPEGECKWAFMRMSDLKRHMKSHQPPEFECPYWKNDPTCHRNGGAFNRLDVLKRHLKLVHYVQEKVPASMGPETKSVKSKAENGWCRSCQKQFANSKEFLSHVTQCAENVNPTEWKRNYGMQDQQVP